MKLEKFLDFVFFHEVGKISSIMYFFHEVGQTLRELKWVLDGIWHIIFDLYGENFLDSYSRMQSPTFRRDAMGEFNGKVLIFKQKRFQIRLHICIFLYPKFNFHGAIVIGRHRAINLCFVRVGMGDGIQQDGIQQERFFLNFKIL